MQQKIKNITKNNIIANKITLCDTMWKRATGLMFHLPIKDEGYIFTFHKEIIAGIHMLFVFYPIDIIWLNKNKEIVAIKSKIPPFCPNYTPNKKAKYFIELPNKTIKNKNIEIGDKIEWKL